jgi:Protein of unknown function (DUF3616)
VSSPSVAILRACAIAAVAILADADGLAAQATLTPVATQWRVHPDFQKSVEARINLSGAACAVTEPPFRSCLIANDEKKYAQLFRIEGTTIVPRDLIRLEDKNSDGDPDAEGAAFADPFFYVVGSHGRSRHHAKRHNRSSYVLFRFPVDQQSGWPTFEPSGEEEVVGLQSSQRLRKAIKRAARIKAHYDQPLDENGVNIEGIAVKAGRMHLGLRGPSVHGHAFILTVDADAAFAKKQDLKASVTEMKLGKDTGIRDLAAVHDGVLVLSGPVNEQQVPPALFHWNAKSGALKKMKKLGELEFPPAVDAKAKAEILLVLRDQANEPWRVLVMFDGPENGAPTEYLVPR